MWIDVPDARLRAERWPGEEPRVVLLHAGVCDLRSWLEVGPLLEDLDVVAYDRRGHGETTFDREATFSHLEDLRAVLDGRPAWLVGSSMGGALAISAAIGMPELVSGLVLISPAVYGAAWPDPPIVDPAADDLGARLEATEDLDEGGRIAAHLWLDGPDQPEGRVGGATRELAIDMSTRMWRHDLTDEDGDPGVDAWSRLEEIAVPVTVAIGDLDEKIAHFLSQTVAERTGGTLRTLAGRAHLPYLEDPGETARLIQDALKAAH
jgi:pimeloyl-ACP methyl ester carboxylesterase